MDVPLRIIRHHSDVRMVEQINSQKIRRINNKLMASENRKLRIKELSQSRSKSLFLRISLGIFMISLAWAWSAGTLHESLVTKEIDPHRVGKGRGVIIHHAAPNGAGHGTIDRDRKNHRQHRMS